MAIGNPAAINAAAGISIRMTSERSQGASGWVYGIWTNGGSPSGIGLGAETLRLAPFAGTVAATASGGLATAIFQFTFGGGKGLGWIHHASRIAAAAAPTQAGHRRQ